MPSCQQLQRVSGGAYARDEARDGRKMLKIYAFVVDICRI